MKYRTKSADVLNEADRAQRILDWQLFQMEQEKILYTGEDLDRWVPGDDLHLSPAVMRDALDLDAMFFNDDALEEIEQFGPGFWGNCMRPIFQTYEYIEDNLGEGPFTRYEMGYSYPVQPRCTDCDVAWSGAGGDNCWMCGKLFAWPKPKLPAPARPRFAEMEFRMPAPRVSFGEVETTIDGVVVQATLDFSPFTQAMENVGRSSRQIDERMQGMHAHFTLTDEQWRFISGFDRDAYSIDYNMDLNVRRVVRYEPPKPPSNPFKREEREIELMPKVYAEPLPPSPNVYARRFGRRPITFASEWERQLYRPIASDERYLPRRRDLDNRRQHTEVHQSSWPGVEVVTERRRR